MTVKTRQAYVHPPNMMEYRLEYQDGAKPRIFHARNDEEVMTFAAGIFNRGIHKKGAFQRAVVGFLQYHHPLPRHRIRRVALILVGAYVLLVLFTRLLLYP